MAHCLHELKIQLSLVFRQSDPPPPTGRGICGKGKRNRAEATRLSILHNRLLRRTGALRATPRSPLAIHRRQRPLAEAVPPHVSARDVLAKASEAHPQGIITAALIPDNRSACGIFVNPAMSKERRHEVRIYRGKRKTRC